MSKGHVLVVEDNLDNYELVRTILEFAGYDTFLAVNGEDGVTAASKQKPDLILMDMSLPEMDGWEATKLIRGNPDTTHIPMIALTVHTLPLERRRALEAGVDAYLPKPYDAGQLIRVVEGVLKNSKQKKKKNK
jgi:CheY-like chemotaxis protein